MIFKKRSVIIKRLTNYIYFAGKYRTNCQYLLPIFGIATILICFSLSMVKLGYDLQIGCCDFKSGNFCADWAIGNGICDAANNFAICGNHDGGDCIPPNVEGKQNCPYNPEYIGDSNCLNHYNIISCEFDGGDCCVQSMIGDRVCQGYNNFFSCGNYDGGDCIPPNVKRKPNCPYNPEYIGDSNCLSHYNITGCEFDGGDCCVQSMIGDRVCQGYNNFETCDKYDGGDCMAPGNFKENVECPHHQKFIGDGICDNHLR